MTVSGHALDKTKDLGKDEIDSEISDFILKVSNAIEGARAQMSDEEREQADRRAQAILENATSGSTASRRRA